jgi:hypothetical protein
MVRSFAALLGCVVMLSLASCGGGDDGKDSSKAPISGKQANGVPVGDSASAGGEVENYEPTGEVISDSNFRPESDGFQFENYGNELEGQPEGPVNLTPANVQDLYGDQVCLAGTEDDCTLIPAAQTWMDNSNAAMSIGHCEGMSITALRIFNEELAAKDYGAASTGSLEILDNTELQSTIAENWVYQALQPILDARVKGKPSVVLNTLIDALDSGDEHYTLLIFKRDGTGGHAITPYAVEDKGDGTYAILVYDNNFPGITRAVAVDLNKETWSYSGGQNPDDLGQLYEGDATTDSLSLDPETPLGENYAPCPFCSGETVATDNAGSTGSVLPADKRFAEITLNGTATNHPHLVFTDEQGRKTGIVNGKLLQQIPDVEVVKTFSVANWKGGPEPRYRVPQDGEFSITVDGSKLTKPTKATINMLTNGLVIDIDDIVMAPGQSDELFIPGGDTTQLTYQSNSTEEQAPSFFAGLVEDDTAYNFAGTAVGVKKGSVVSMVIDQKQKIMFLDSTGSEGAVGGKGVFIMNLTEAGADGKIHQWQNGDIRLDGTKGEKVGYSYDDLPKPEEKLPLILLDKNANVTDTVFADPQ